MTGSSDAADVDEVQVWRIALDGNAEAVSRARSVLDADERRRADSLRTPILQRRFVLAHAALRRILAGCLGADSAAIRFTYGPHGKPELAPGFSSAWRFNLTHSHDVALCAVSHGLDVGIDLEHLRPLDALERVGAGFLSPQELGWLDSLPHAGRLPAFYRLWVRHEALAKALGWGLARPLDGVDLRSPGAVSAPDGSRWTVSDLEVDPAYAAALAREGETPLRIRFRETSAAHQPFAM